MISARRCVAKDFGMAQQIWQAYSLKKTNLICPSDLEKIEINNLGLETALILRLMKCNELCSKSKSDLDEYLRSKILVTKILT